MAIQAADKEPSVVEDATTEGPIKHDRLIHTENALFAVLCGIIFSCVIIYLLLGAIGAVEVKDRSGIEGRAYTVTPELSICALAEKTFQNNTEAFVADHIPGRDTIILSNSVFQRSFIKVANTVFGYECFPTKFGSIFAEVPSMGMVVVTSPAPNNRDVEGAKTWISAVKAIREANPDVRFIYDVIDDTYTSEFNPTRKYVTRYWTPGWIQNNVCDPLEASGIEVIYDPIASREEFANLWLKTEHHWTLERALDSYDKIGNALDWVKVPREDAFEVTDCWFGSSDRQGLDFNYHDALIDIPIDYSGLSCKINGEDGYRSMKEKLAHNMDVKIDFGKPPTNAYSTYFGDTCGEAIWRNSNNPAGGTCLFIEQSYGPPLEPYIAKNYATTVCIDPLNTKRDKSFSDYITEYNPDVVVIQLGVRDLHKIGENSPSWV